MSKNFIFPAMNRWRDHEPFDLELRRVFKTFAPVIGCEFCIAGGAVRDRVHYLKPKDYDLFCFGKPDWRRLFAEFEAPADQQHQYRDMHCLNLIWTLRQYIEPGCVQRTKRTIQVVYRDGLETIPQLLDEFDWCCAQYAWDGHAVRTIGTTQGIKPGGVLRLANPKTPETSLARGRRFAERFGMTIDPEALQQLQDQIDGSRRLKVLAEHGHAHRRGAYQKTRRLAA